MATSSAAPTPDGITEGDKCHDVEEHDGILVVLERTGEVAANYELTPGISVASIYTMYPPHDEVLVCAYERDLETAGEATCHYFPESKLTCYAAGNWTEHAEGVDCEHCGELVGTTSDWVRHVVTECPANPT